MAKNKSNPLLAAYEAKLERVYDQKLHINTEMDMIALLLTVRDHFKVGPGRAGKILNDFAANKMKIVHDIIDDYGDKENGDKEIIYTKHSYAKQIKAMMSPEDWKEWRCEFPLLYEYWDDEESK